MDQALFLALDSKSWTLRRKARRKLSPFSRGGWRRQKRGE